MIFVDTNVLLDILEGASTTNSTWSRKTLTRLAERSTLVSNLIVAAEISGQANSPSALNKTFETTDIALIDLDLPAAHRAGEAFREYRRRGGKRASILADFLIGAHAISLGATLLTRDRGIGSYFPGLALITPETHPHD